MSYDLFTYPHKAGFKDNTTSRDAAEAIEASGRAGTLGHYVLCQYRATAKKLFDVNRSAFTPPPKVTSSIVQLMPKANPEPECRLEVLERVTAAAFGQRRKTLRNTLKAVFSAEKMAQLPVDLGLRAENLGVDDYVRLAALVEPDGAVA